MGCGALLRWRNQTAGSSAREAGWSIIELTISLFLLMTIALFGMNTIVSGFNMENWSIGQSMTDAYAGIETAYAQRIVFNNIPSDPRWGNFTFGSNAVGITTTVTIGQTPFNPVQAQVTRTCCIYTLDPVTAAPSYMLESYVVYTSGKRSYCKVSKVYRSE
jgi:hypothetical protein